MLARVTHRAAVAGSRAITSKVVPRLQAHAAVLTRIRRAFVYYFTRVHQHVHAGHPVVGVGDGTIVLGPDVLRSDLTTCILGFKKHLQIIIYSQIFKPSLYSEWEKFLNIRRNNLSN